MNTKSIAIIGLSCLIAMTMYLWKIFGPDLDAGKRLADNNCGVCHDLSNQQVHKRGPYLWGVVDRSAGSVDFPFSIPFRQLIQHQPFLWDEATLERFISDPDKFINGTKMAQKDSKHPIAFEGILDATNRRNLIAYLKTLK